MSAVVEENPSFQLDVPLRVEEDGGIRIGSTRVHLDTVITAHRMGDSAEAIAESYPSLKLSEVHAVLAWCLAHPAEIDAYIARRENEAQEIRRKIEERQGPMEGLRAKLEARLAANQRP